MRRNSRLADLLSSPVPAGDALRKRLQMLQAGLDRELARLARRIDAEGVHRTRVAARRLRVLLHAFRKSLDPEAGKAYRRALRALARELDPLRDADVAAARFAALAADERSATAAARAQLAADRADALRVLRASLGGSRWRLRAIGLRSAAADAGLVAADSGPLPALLARVLGRERRRARKALRGAGGGVQALHRLRLEMKKLRYLAEECAHSQSGAAAREIEELHAMQDCLGELHDGALLRARLRTLVARRRTRRRLRDRLDRRARKLLAQYRRGRKRLLRLWRGASMD